MASLKIADIKNDLIDQLETQSKYGKYYLDMVDDYIYFYKLKKKLKSDIEKRGIRITVTNGNGIEVEKPNENVINLAKINSQMLKILNDLGLQQPSLPSSEGSTTQQVGDECDLL